MIFKIFCLHFLFLPRGQDCASGEPGARFQVPHLAGELMWQQKFNVPWSAEGESTCCCMAQRGLWPTQMWFHTAEKLERPIEAVEY